MLYKTKRKIGMWLGTIMLIAIASYSAFEVKNIVRGPQLAIDYPSSGMTVHGDSVTLKGHAMNISKVRLNGGDLFTDLKGYFSKDILLSPGYNVIEIRAEDNLGRHVDKEIELVALTSEPATPVANAGGSSF